MERSDLEELKQISRNLREILKKFDELLEKKNER